MEEICNFANNAQQFSKKKNHKHKTRINTSHKLHIITILTSQPAMPCGPRILSAFDVIMFFDASKRI